MARRKRTPGGSRLSPETDAWLDTPNARLFFEQPENYAELTRPPRPVCHLPEVRPWWCFPDVLLASLRGKMRPASPPSPGAVAFVKLIEDEWQRRHGPARNLKRGRNHDDD
jgi:hypothetical protein